MRVRRDVRTLTGLELRTLREAFRKLRAQRSGRGHAHICGLHGGPPVAYAPQHTGAFLPWYRLHLLDLERALRRHAPGVSLPYWNWSLPGAADEGLPTAFTDATYEAVGGRRHPNPLRKGWLASEERATCRRPGSPRALRRLRRGVQLAFARTSFYEEEGGLDVTSALEQVHESLCTWVGGDMATLRHAAFDPLFFCHLANLDRLWAEWQAVYPLASIPAPLASRELAPYGTTLGSTVCHRHFDYSYDTLVGGAPAASATRSPWREEASDEGLHLRVGGLRTSRRTYWIRVFVDAPHADARTPTEGNPSFVDTIAVWGTGDGVQLSDPRPEHARVVDLGPALQRRTSLRDRLQVRLVVVDEQGREVPLAALGSSVSMGMVAASVPEERHAEVS